MGMDTARANYTTQLERTRGQYWEMSSEFDFLLSQLLAQDSMLAKDFARRYREDPASAGDPPDTPLSRVEAIWGELFPGRSLRWDDWKPQIVSAVAGSEVRYSGNQMSDGEKAALYLAARVFSSEAGVLIVDEPETHFHTLLAVRLWNVLEAARPDIRFVYVTHDVAFGLSRRNAQFMLASPTEGLRKIDIGNELPSDVAYAILGSASLSFYASRVVFCEGDPASLDAQLYGSWFDGIDTVLRPVDSCQSVLKCVDALNRSGVTRSLDVVGIIDRDYHPDAFMDALPEGVHVLPVHEVESLLAIPALVEAIASHLGRDFDYSSYIDTVKRSVNEVQARSLTVRRWKECVEPLLVGQVARVDERSGSFDELAERVADALNRSNWQFEPSRLFDIERQRVETDLAGDDPLRILALVPGKQLLPIAARAVGMEKEAYVALVTKALADRSDGSLHRLKAALIAILTPLLPERAVPPVVLDLPNARQAETTVRTSPG